MMGALAKMRGTRSYTCNSRLFQRLRPSVLGMRSCRVKLDEENPKYAGLAQENGFGNSLCCHGW